MSVKMVDVSGKLPTLRRAKAMAEVRAAAATVKRIAEGSTPKGNVLDLAKVAGITAAKKTAELLPLCHPLGLEAVEVDTELRGDRVRITAACSNFGKTGPEMEALTAASVAALTVYDMCKGIDSSITFSVALLEKSGGKSSRK